MKILSIFVAFLENMNFKESGDCESFEYGGCDANANNFEDKETCENRCKIPKALPKATFGFMN